MYQQASPAMRTTAMIRNFSLEISSIKSLSLIMIYYLVDQVFSELTLTYLLHIGQTQMVLLKKQPMSRTMRDILRLTKMSISQMMMRGKYWVDQGRGSNLQTEQMDYYDYDSSIGFICAFNTIRVYYNIGSYFNFIILSVYLVIN